MSDEEELLELLDKQKLINKVTCNKCETAGHINFDKGVVDAYCSYCGNWQKSREYSTPEPNSWEAEVRKNEWRL